LQAQDSIQWIKRNGVRLDSTTTVLSLGCGFGDFGGELAKIGCRVALGDDDSYVLPEYAHLPFRHINIDRDELQALGRYDLVICSNVFEHLSKPDRLLSSMHELLNPEGKLYFSWTNWCSP